MPRHYNIVSSGSVGCFNDKTNRGERKNKWKKNSILHPTNAP